MNTRNWTVVRIGFGLVWAIDAWFKWQPAFLNGLASMLTSLLEGQPAWVQAWLHLWIRIISVNPHLFAIIVAIIETLIAICLIFGYRTRLVLKITIVFSLLIWSVGEAFGSPYVTGSTDIGSAIMYAFTAAALLVSTS